MNDPSPKVETHSMTTKEFKEKYPVKHPKEKFNAFDFVEPCEENCTPERHAYHQGQWDMAKRIETYIDIKTEEFGIKEIHPHLGRQEGK